MQRVITGKYFSVQYIVSYRDIHAYVYRKYSDTLNTLNMLCPLQSQSNISLKISMHFFLLALLKHLMIIVLILPTLE